MASRRGVITVTLLTAAMLLPFLWPYLQGLIPASSEPSPRPLELMVKAAMHLNTSDTLLASSVEPGANMPPGIGNMSYEAQSIASQLRRIAEEQPPSRLGRVIGNAAQAYSHMASAASDMYIAASSLSGASPRIRRAFELLAQCRIDEALEEYGEARAGLITARRLLDKAYGEIAETDPRSLLSENHTVILRRAEDHVSSLIKSLKEVDRTFSLVEQHREAFKHLCSGNLTQADIQELRGVLDELRPGDAGSFGYEEASIASMIQEALMQHGAAGGVGGGIGQGQGGQGQGTSQGSGQTGGGEGAGYGAPSSDD